MDGHTTPTLTQADFRSVRIVEAGGEWFVRVVEGSEETTSPGFERETFAVSYAQGQCLRLGLPEFARA